MEISNVIESMILYSAGWSGGKMIIFRLFKGLVAACLWFPWRRGDDGQQATRGITVKSVSTQVLVILTEIQLPYKSIPPYYVHWLDEAACLSLYCVLIPGWCPCIGRRLSGFRRVSCVCLETLPNIYLFTQVIQVCYCGEVEPWTWYILM